ncbi:hypothetical protein CC_0997 [Caulobacter vibrioides CB15]|uniref:Uncharacterized protein n=1 Tax=Caulobacter vibrioides (strain ATCC 19089 / CIP 103742 / CB 15) TaxID=190650 RepID=Q9A9I3_CAUVC|nr:hypothetical protein CC_0997 [Caulobacter vibrioides CB15]ATC27832.1 hypothetical protein CA607_05320 [Caulobacter vibrioides]
MVSADGPGIAFAIVRPRRGPDAGRGHLSDRGGAGADFADPCVVGSRGPAADRYGLAGADVWHGGGGGGRGNRRPVRRGRGPAVELRLTAHLALWPVHPVSPPGPIADRAAFRRHLRGPDRPRLRAAVRSSDRAADPSAAAGGAGPVSRTHPPGSRPVQGLEATGVMKILGSPARYEPRVSPAAFRAG